MIGNQLTLIGRMSKDIIAFDNKDGSKKLIFTLACERSYKNKEGEKITDFIPCEMFVKAEKVEATMKRFENTKTGSLLAIEGCLRKDKFEKDGETMYELKAVIESVKFLESKAQAEARASK